MIGNDDWSLFMDPSVFGDPVIYRPDGAPVFETAGIFTMAAAEVARGGFGPGVSGAAPVLTLPPADQLPVDPAPGDVVSLRAADWRVADVQTDGAGMVRLILERA